MMISKEYRMEKITNRILINLGAAFVAYIVLWVLYSKFFMPNTACFTLAGIFCACGILFACLTKFKEYPLKNYAYMSFALMVAMLFMKSAAIITMFIGPYKCASLQNIGFFRTILNTTTEVKIVAILGAVYLAIMLVHSFVAINKISKEKN